jgi:inner membrane protein
MLPDADVLAFKFGIPYAHPFGHRGASHSIAFALMCGVVAWLVARSRGGGAGRWGLVVGLTVLTHPLLDMLTTGGLGVALWWPLSDDRVFFPWRVIPVAPIGWGMLSPRGLYVVMAELGPSIPLVLWALWPSQRKAASPDPPE